jgi:hypothetical protein
MCVVEADVAKFTFYVVTPVDIEAPSSEDALAMLTKHSWRLNTTSMQNNFRSSLTTRPADSAFLESLPKEVKKRNLLSDVLARLCR